MQHSKKRLDISYEFAILPYSSGIKLIKPNQLYIGKKHTLYTGQPINTVADILKLPINIYFLNQQSVMQKINEVCGSTMGFVSAKDSFGKTMFNVSPAANAQRVINTDMAVIKTKTLKIVEDNVLHFDGVSQNFLTIKLPWYDHENKIIGIFGLSILFGHQPLADSLTRVAQLGLLNMQQPLVFDQLLRGSMINDIYFTERECDVLRYLIRGRSARNIAVQLNISKRTVEQHLENIKNKLNVTSKAELIETIIGNFI